MITKSKSNRLLKAAKDADWMQVVMNQGPPCFHLAGLTCELIPYPLLVLILVSQSALWWYRVDQRLFEHHSPHPQEHYLYN